MNWVAKMSKYMGIIRQKQSKNRRKSKSRAKTAKTRTTTGTHGRASRAHDHVSLHHGLCALPRVARGGHCFARSRRFLIATFWPLFDLSLDLGSSCFEPRLQLCLIYMPQLHLAWIKLSHFSKKLGLNHRNLQSTLNKPKPSVIGENMHKSQINAN